LEENIARAVTFQVEKLFCIEVFLIFAKEIMHLNLKMGFNPMSIEGGELLNMYQF
jgi:hypothetical protein